MESKQLVRIRIQLVIALFGLALHVSKGAVNNTGNGVNEKDINVDTKRCVCDGECERITEEDCRWGLTLDFCGCCLLCSRGEGEPCGGALGTCAYGLYCRNDDPERLGEGTCSKAGKEKVCEEKPVNRYGCLFHGGSCICEKQTVCPEMEMFLFDTEESCRSRVAILMAARQEEPSFHTGASTSQLENTGEPQRATVNCSEVACEPVQDCPPDSYRLPAMSVHYRPEETNRRTGSRTDDCCPIVQKCQCNPGHLCPKPECPPGWQEKFIVNATGEPGNCCPLLECSPPIQAERIREERKLCSYGDVLYEPGDRWMNLEEECSECTCSPNGVFSCQWIKCDDVPTECRVARAPPDSCCPVCAGCITSNGRVYNNSETWEEDECTLCECEEGKVKCHAAVCQAACDHPVFRPGECCPTCPPEELRDDEEMCPQVDCGGRECAGGYLLDVHGCPTCQCNECSALDCSLDCPLGFKLDSHGCPHCSCIQPTSSTVDQPRKEYQRRMSNASSGGCTSLDGKHGVIARAESDEWWDGCRHCVCKDGLEMCTLISCNPPECEHPIFYPGDCCPRCPGDEAALPRQVNSTCTGGTRGSKRTWRVNECLTCSCHNSLAVCSHPICPPAPCEVSSISGGHDDGDDPPPCCHTCALTQEPISRGEVRLITATTTPKIHGTKSADSKNVAVGNISSVVDMRKCFSDDNHHRREYDDGESWTTGPCQSCICRNGKIECFSSWRSCPPLSCDQPVFAKNQCCPICLELTSTTVRNSHGKTSDLNPLVAILLVVVLCLVFIIALFTLRFVYQQRRSRRRLGDTSNNKPAPNYC